MGEVDEGLHGPHTRGSRGRRPSVTRPTSQPSFPLLLLVIADISQSQGPSSEVCNRPTQYWEGGSVRECRILADAYLDSVLGHTSGACPSPNVLLCLTFCPTGLCPCPSTSLTLETLPLITATLYTLQRSRSEAPRDPLRSTSKRKTWYPSEARLLIKEAPFAKRSNVSFLQILRKISVCTSGNRYRQRSR